MIRSAGILMHITSLPSKYGIGTLGKEAYKFVDFLAKSGQSYWQVLPLNPTSYGDSPYQSSSVFAYNQYLIDLDMLHEMGLLKPRDYKKEYYGNNDLDVDYANMFIVRNRVLKKTWPRHELYKKEFNKFKKENSSWLDSFALYESIKESFNYTPWYEWNDSYRLRDDKTIKKYIKNNKDDIEYRKFIQFLFYYQWIKLKKYANSKNIKIIGDMPIYAAYDSADVWANPSKFYLDEDLKPIKVAGCPPDGFTPDGQLWGNPLYRWDKMKEENYSWWVDRIKNNKKLFDVVRIDHFRGFAGYFSIPYGDINAKNGVWVEGPGYDLFKTINEEVKDIEIIAENLGFLDQSVYDLLDQCGYPGMQVMEFDFGDGYDYHPLQDGLKDNNVIYTGTHDNQTIRSWYNESNPHLKWCIEQYFNIHNEEESYKKIIEGTLKTNVNLSIIPMQDYLGLYDYQGRMNTPSTLGINWRWRVNKKSINRELSKYIYKVTKESNRLQ